MSEPFKPVERPAVEMSDRDYEHLIGKAKEDHRVREAVHQVAADLVRLGTVLEPRQ